MRTRATTAVVLSALVLLAGAGLAVGLDSTERAADRSGPADPAAGSDAVRAEQVGQYKVSADNITIETWLLRNSTVENATVREVVIRNATTPDGARENVTLSNVTVGEFVVDRGRLKNVTAQTLVVRNKSVLDVPGGSLFDPDVRDRTVDRHWTQNQTVAGVVIDTLVVDAGIMEENATLGDRTDDPSAYSPVAAESDPDITVENGTVGEALVINGTANHWAVESVSGANATDG